MTWLRPWSLAVREALAFARRHGVVRAIRLGVSALSILGPGGLVRRAAAETRQRDDDRRYQDWLTTHTPGAGDLAKLQAEVSTLPHRPTISIATAVFNTDPRWLRRCVESVRAQAYGRWQLCLCDDGSTNALTVEALQALGTDDRIRIVRSARNGGIVDASNAALALATGDFVGFLDHDDELAPEALAEIVQQLNVRPDLDILYTDEDKIDEIGTRSQPHFKPDWSPELLRSCMYVSHFAVIRRKLVEAAGAFRPGTDGAQDYDLMLRATGMSPRIAHIPKVLYHWRTVGSSAASSRLEKPWAVVAGRRVLEEHLRRRGIDAEVLPAEAAGHYRVRHAIIGSPLVSIVIPAGSRRDEDERFSRWLRALDGRIRYPNHEVLVVRDQTLADAARAARGDHVLVLRPLAKPLGSDWIDALLEFSQQPEIGAAGGIVLSSDDTIDNAGFVLGADGVPLPAFRGEPVWTRGHLANILDVRDCAAIGAACLMTRRAVFEHVGGFDIPGGNACGVDYCLRVRRAGFRVVITPYAKVSQPEADDVSPADVERLRAAWGNAALQDPYYNPNFDQHAATFRLPMIR